MSTRSLGFAEAVEGLPDGVLAWTTSRADGSYGLGSTEPVVEVMERWAGLQDRLASLGVQRLATAHQVHGAAVARHGDGWHGWLRLRGVDGHVSATPTPRASASASACARSCAWITPSRSR